MSRDFKGVWIPKEIWLSPDLTIMEKLFLVEIDSLDGKNGCYASNAKFSEFFQISKGRCTQIIKSLEQKKLIKITLIRDGKAIKKRVIRVVNKLNRVVNKLNHPSENSKYPYLENDEGSNTNFSNTKESNTSEREARAKTPISENFKPDENTLFQCRKNGLKPLDESELLNFVLHYQSKDEFRADWQKTYLKWVVNQRRIFDKHSSNQNRGYSLDELGEDFVNDGELKNGTN